ncbi:MAG: DUF2934 domain-containing protein [Thiothrix sp.]|uniref:DUF2934 domain-containing protein n=1 Tax=Thiothrix sp. TaxID=1032 RepID=UPI00262A38EC|nr:DUF2934 domain-containing protein [Thiothrix sp.]MDD5394513.1 DUF2934 domain-containing protein [Thiothrix sp.]
MLYCPGEPCPLRNDCYRHTQPSPGRDRFASLPYDAVSGTCEWFQSNTPSESAIREAAYYIWLRKGCPENRAAEHWDEAYRGLCLSMGRVG